MYSQMLVIVLLCLGCSWANKFPVVNITMDEFGECSFKSQLPNITTIGKINFIVPGWLQTVNTVLYQDMADKIVSQGEVVIMVNWTAASSNWFYPTVNLRPSAKCLANYISKNFCKTNPNINIIGYGFGAHLAGLTGRYLQQNLCTIPRITALDPTGLDYLFLKKKDSLQPTDATLVIHLHTGDASIGNFRHLGKVNFYANYGFYQPLCPFSPASSLLQATFCSSMRSILLYKEAIGSKGFVAKRCADIGFCKDNDTLSFNDKIPLTAIGDYYFSTNIFSPYSLN